LPANAAQTVETRSETPSRDMKKIYGRGFGFGGMTPSVA